MFWTAAMNAAPLVFRRWQSEVHNQVSDQGWRVASVERMFEGFQAAVFNSKIRGTASLSCGSGFIVDGAKAHPVDSLPPDILSDLLRKGPRSGQYSCIVQNSEGISAQTDLYGLKPVYFVQRAGSIFLSSDLRAMFLLPGQKLRPSEAIIATMLEPENAAEDNELPFRDTAYEGIQKLPVLHRLSFGKSGDVSIEPIGFRLPEIDSHLVGPRAINAVEDKLSCLVGALLKDHPNASVFDLSGGIDSAAVVSAAIRSGHVDRVSTASLVFESEGHYANDRGLIELFKTKHKLPGKYFDAADQIKNEYNHVPFLGPGTVASFSTLLATQAHATRLSAPYHFTGEGADFHFEGSSILFDFYAQNGRFKPALANMIRNAGGRRSLRQYRLAALASLIRSPVRLESFLVDRPKKKLRLHRLVGENGRRILRQYTRPANPEIARLRQQASNFSHLKSFDMLFPRAAYTDLFAHMPVQMVAPFLDRSMIDLAFRIAPDEFIDPELIDPANTYASAKKLLRSAFAEETPDAIRNKPTKTTYNDLALMLLRENMESMRAVMLDHSSTSLIGLGILDREALTHFMDGLSLLSQFDSTSLGEDYIYFLQIFELQRWMRMIGEDQAAFVEASFESHRSREEETCYSVT
jgi:asparagine synthase (glutamine-hydrolysing)